MWIPALPVSCSLFNDGLHVSHVGQKQSHIQHAFGDCLLCCVQVHVQAGTRTSWNLFKEEGHNWSWVIRRLYRNWPQDGSSNHRTPEQVALGYRSTTSREFCVLCPPCVCACARLYQMNDKGSNPAEFTLEDVFHCRYQESSISWISLIWYPHIVGMWKPRFEMWSLKVFWLAALFPPIGSLVSNLGFLLVSFSPNKRHCFISRPPGTFYSIQQRASIWNKVSNWLFYFTQ